MKYNARKDSAPRLTARGTGRMADRIIEIARAHNIFVHDDPDLVEVLSQLDLQAEIPTELYVVVAELLSFVYSINAGKTCR